MYPSSVASIAIVALSVSTSAIASPALISSPIARCHRAIPPRAIVGDSAGIGSTSTRARA